MDVLAGFFFIAAAIVVYLLYLARLTPEQRKDRFETAAWGPVQAPMICPHCQTRGMVRTKQITKKAGISGGKATAALVTGGLSVLATGLSRKEHPTQAHCGKCSATWTF